MLSYEERGYDGASAYDGSKDPKPAVRPSNPDPPGVRVLSIADLRKSHTGADGKGSEPTGVYNCDGVKVSELDLGDDVSFSLVVLQYGFQTEVYLTCSFCGRPLEGAWETVWWEDLKGDPHDVQLGHYGGCSDAFESMHPEHKWIKRGHRHQHIVITHYA